MNINEAKEEKVKLRAAIIASSAICIAQFETKTGLNIKSVNLDFIHEKEIGESEGKYILSGANIEIDFQI